MSTPENMAEATPPGPGPEGPTPDNPAPIPPSGGEPLKPPYVEGQDPRGIDVINALYPGRKEVTIQPEDSSPPQLEDLTPVGQDATRYLGNMSQEIKSLEALGVNLKDIQLLLSDGETVETIKGAIDSLGSDFSRILEARLAEIHKKQADTTDDSAAEEPESVNIVPPITPTSLTSSTDSEDEGKEPDEESESEQPPVTPVTGEILTHDSKPLSRVQQAINRFTGRSQSEESPIPGLTQEDIELFSANGYPVDYLLEQAAKMGTKAFLGSAKEALKGMRSSQPAGSSPPPEQPPTAVSPGSPEPDEEGSEDEQELAGPSPVAGLSNKEVKLLLSKHTIEEMLEAKKKLGITKWREEADRMLREIKENDEEPLPPEEREEQRQKNIERLREDLKELKTRSRSTITERRAIQLRKMNIDHELQDLGVDGHEGPPEPPDKESLEYEASPERGKEIAAEIIYWEALRAAGKYGDVDWQRLKEIYIEQEVHIEAVRMRYWMSEDSNLTGESTETIQPVRMENIDLNNLKLNGVDLKPLAQWLKLFDRKYIRDQDQFNKEIDIYFGEAKKVGLLADIDKVLKSIYTKEVVNGIKRGLSIGEIMNRPSGRGDMAPRDALASAVEGFNLTFAARVAADPNVRRLGRIGELYVELARGRMALAINNRDFGGTVGQSNYLDNEFRLDQVEEDEVDSREPYWKTSWGTYVEVYAQNEEQFMIAAETWLNRRKAIKASPTELIQEANQFGLVLMNSDGARNVSEEFLRDLVLGMEARLGVFGADHSSENYHPDNYKQFLDFINKDAVGPDRYRQLFTLAEGKVAAAVFLMDKDPRWEILFSTFGSRGQLAHNANAQRGNRGGDQGLFQQAKELFIEELMGISIKDTAKMKDLGKRKSDQAFTELFDGLYRYNPDGLPAGYSYGDGPVQVFERLNSIPQAERTVEQRQSMRSGSGRFGRIQTQIRENEDITPADKKFYDRFYKEEKKKADSAFEVAFELLGTLGEKSKRAGGVFKIDKVDTATRGEYQDFVPVHYAEKFVQFAETMTKIKYANAKAELRTAKVKVARARAIAEFKAHGFESKLYDEDGNQMMLKQPKADPNSPDGIAYNARGQVIVEEVPVDFHVASHHIYGDWTSVTYHSYQEEDRHNLLDPAAFEQAREILAGRKRPEDADPWAIQLLIIDPTLKRVRRFAKNFESRERKLTMAAVEDSYQSHWRLSRELYQAFFPKYGSPEEEIKIYYGLQDYGGLRKMLDNSRARAAEDPARFARRGMRMIPYIHIPVAGLSEIWGMGSQGALGVMRSFGTPGQRMGRTTALDKFSAQQEIGWKMYESLFVTDKDEKGNIIEPLLLKLTNESDALNKFFNRLPGDPRRWKPDQQFEFRAAVRDSFGRLERYEKLIATMESMVRNATGAMWIENVDIFDDEGGALNRMAEVELNALPDISNIGANRDDLLRFVNQANVIEGKFDRNYNELFNTGKDKGKAGLDEGSISRTTGTGRTSAKIWHDEFFQMFLDEGSRGGLDSYPFEKYIYQHIKDQVVFTDPSAEAGIGVSNEDIIHWLFTKFVPT